MENIKKVFLQVGDDFDNCYIFSPSVSKERVINGKKYHIRSYFNGHRDFANSMKQLAINNYYKKEI